VIWSISASRTFRRCQRQWYFKSLVANANAKKDPVRRRAYLLSKLQSIWAWRGQIVDSVISDRLVRAINAGGTITLADARAEARRLFDLQLAFAREHRLHEPGMSVTKAGDAFAAFYCMEYDGEIDDNEIERAWQDVEMALGTLYKLRDVADAMKSARYLVAQRALCFSHSGETVRAVPDLIAFHDDQPPMIIDWKVHTLGQHEAWLQLGTYAVALALCSPHNDFPQGRQWVATDIRLLEVQLLTGVVRQHHVTEESARDIDAYIADSVNQIRLAMQRKDKRALAPEDFPTTSYAEACSWCPYKVLCWEEEV